MEYTQDKDTCLSGNAGAYQQSTLQLGNVLLYETCGYCTYVDDLVLWTMCQWMEEKSTTGIVSTGAH